MKKDISRRNFLKASGITAACGMALVMNPLAAEAKEKGEKCSDKFSLPGTYNTIATDVVVVGAGCAGIEASINVLKSGANVVIIDKKLIGRCGNSGQHTSGAMVSANDFAKDGDSLEEHMKDAIETGRYIVNQKIGEEILKEYRDDAVTLKSENYGNLHLRDSKTGEPTFEYSRTKKRRWAGYRLQNQTFEAMRLGAKILDYHTVTRILTSKDKKICGVAAVDFKTGEFVIVRAKCVILATGGGSAIWGGSSATESSVGYGSTVGSHACCAYGLTGDGHSMAAALGVVLKDMEFRTTSPCGFLLAGANVAYMCPDITVSEDINGNKFLDSIPKSELTNRRVMYEKAIVRQKGGFTKEGACKLPVTSLRPTVLKGAGEYIEVDGWGFFQPHPMAFMKMWANRGFNLKNGMANDVCLYDYGGIFIDSIGRTNINGLYAVGELAMHCGAEYGAFRVFSSAMAIGHYTGKHAADFATKTDYYPIDFDQVAETYKHIYSIFERKKGITVRELKNKVQNAAWEGAGAWKSEKSGKEALAILKQAKKDYKNVYLRDKSKVCNIEWLEYLQIQNTIKYAEMATLASMTRTESRGAHYRAEFSDMDNDKWLKNIYLTEVNGEIKVDVKPVVVTKYPLPSGKLSQGGGTLND
ncbi:MAG: FAD-binding protein [Deferribacterales bacterium]